MKKPVSMDRVYDIFSEQTRKQARIYVDHDCRKNATKRDKTDQQSPAAEAEARRAKVPEVA